MFEPTSAPGFLVMMLRARLEAARRSERGASAVEWVVIAAIVVAICIGVGAALQAALDGKATEIGNEIRGS